MSITNINIARSCHRIFAATAILSVILLGICSQLWRGIEESIHTKMMRNENPVSTSSLLKQQQESYEGIHMEPKLKPSPRRCLSFDGDMDALIEQSKQIFLVMLPKAAGTASAEFTRQCMADKGLPLIRGNRLNNQEQMEEIFINDVNLPTIMSSHLYKGDKTLLKLIKQTTKNSLIIFIHREETDRVLSAIKMIVNQRLCGGMGNLPDREKYMKLEGNKCTIPEQILINPIIKNRLLELGNGANGVLTCDVYDAIQEHAPNLVFMDFKQLNQLQTALAKHKCPGLLPKLPIFKVIETSKDLDVRIQLKTEGRQVPFSKWLEAKSDLIEFSLSLKDNAQCQAQTRMMETDLSSCPDNLLQVSSASFSPFTSLLAP